MTKRWSSSRSDLTKTKRQVSKEYRRTTVQLVKRLAAEPADTTFDSADDLMRWLDSNDGEEQSR